MLTTMISSATDSLRQELSWYSQVENSANLMTDREGCSNYSQLLQCLPSIESIMV